MPRLLLLPLAFLLLASGPARAQEDDDNDAEETQAAPAQRGGAAYRIRQAPSRQAAPPPAATIDADRAQDDGSAGVRQGATTGWEGNGPSRPGQPLGGGRAPSTGGNAPAGGGGGDVVVKGPLMAYDRWRDVPKWRGSGTTETSFNSGPGTTFAVGFPGGPHVLWSWVESVNSTYDCTYKAWIAAKPGGGPLPGPCTMETGATGGHLVVSGVIKNKVEAQYICPVTTGQRYWFHMQLVKWGPNPHANNVYSCIEHILPQGDAATIFKE